MSKKTDKQKTKKPKANSDTVRQMGPGGKSRAVPVVPTPEPPKERPPRQYPVGVPRQALLTPDAQTFNRELTGQVDPSWPPMRSTIPPEPDRSDLRRVPFRDWWVLFCVAVLAWFIYSHANGYGPRSTGTCRIPGSRVGLVAGEFSFVRLTDYFLLIIKL